MNILSHETKGPLQFDKIIITSTRSWAGLEIRHAPSKRVLARCYQTDVKVRYNICFYWSCVTECDVGTMPRLCYTPPDWLQLKLSERENCRPNHFTSPTNYTMICAAFKIGLGTSTYFQKVSV